MTEKNDKLSFEKSMEGLEKVVEALESGDLTLDQALKQYEEGVGLVRSCREKLAATEKKIEVLTRALDGSLTKEPFDPDNVSQGATPKKRKSRKTNEEL